MTKNIIIALLTIACLTMAIWELTAHRVSAQSEVAQADIQQLQQPEQPPPAVHSSGGFLTSIFKYTPAADSVPAQGSDCTQETQYIYDTCKMTAFKSVKVTNATVDGVDMIILPKRNEHLCVHQHYNHGYAIGISLPFPKVCKAPWDIVSNDSNRCAFTSGDNRVD